MVAGFKRSSLAWLISAVVCSGFMCVAGAQEPGAPPPPPGRRGEAPPPQRPIQVKGSVGEFVAAGPARYRVVSVTSNLKGYRDQFDQSGKKHRPGFAKDRLAVVVLEIQNVLQRPIEPPVFMAALTTSDGLRVTDWALDARQQPFLDESTRYGRSRTSIPAQIAAGQTAKVALVFSMGPDVKATKLEFAPANFRDMRFGDPARGQRRPPAGPGGPAGMPLRAYRVEIDLK